MKRTIFILAALMGVGLMREGWAQEAGNILPDVSVSRL